MIIVLKVFWLELHEPAGTTWLRKTADARVIGNRKESCFCRADELTPPPTNQLL